MNRLNDRRITDVYNEVRQNVVGGMGEFHAVLPIGAGVYYRSQWFMNSDHIDLFRKIMSFQKNSESI